MSEAISQADLEAYLDEALPPDEMAAIEDAMRNDPELGRKLVAIHGRRDAGVHTLGEIWRRNQIGVPTTEQISNHLLGVLSREESDYIMFRLDVLKCPYTIAMYKDLSAQRDGDTQQSESRRKKYFNSSAGLLRKKDLPDGE